MEGHEGGQGAEVGLGRAFGVSYWIEGLHRLGPCSAWEHRLDQGVNKMQFCGNTGLCLQSLVQSAAITSSK